METLSLLFINYIHLVKYSMLQRLLHYVYDDIRCIILHIKIVIYRFIYWNDVQMYI